MKEKEYLLVLRTTLNEIVFLQEWTKLCQSIEEAMGMIDKAKEVLSDDEILKAQIYGLDLVISERYFKQEKLWEELQYGF